MSTELLEALNGPNGAVDAWLETHSEREVRTAIRALMAPEETLRDKFAAKAMQSLCAMAATGAHTIEDNKHMAIQAYAMADAMLSQRAK